MDKKMKTKWIKALMGGKYVQYSPADSYHFNGMHCCIGVFGDVAFNKPDGHLRHLMNGIGLRDEDIDGLISVNDSGVPFEMIAGLIHEAL